MFPAQVWAVPQSTARKSISPTRMNEGGVGWKPSCAKLADFASHGAECNCRNPFSFPARRTDGSTWCGAKTSPRSSPVQPYCRPSNQRYCRASAAMRGIEDIDASTRGACPSEALVARHGATNRRWVRDGDVRIEKVSSPVSLKQCCANEAVGNIEIEGNGVVRFT